MLEEQIKQNLKKLNNNWEIINNKLTKILKFDYYFYLKDFSDQVFKKADELNHHPELAITDEKEITVSIITHETNQITEKDFILAEQIDIIFMNINLNTKYT